MTLWLIRLFQLDEGRRSSPSFDVAQATAAARIEQNTVQLSFADRSGLGSRPEAPGSGLQAGILTVCP